MKNNQNQWKLDNNEQRKYVSIKNQAKTIELDKMNTDIFKLNND